MLGYIFEWVILIVLVGFVYKACGWRLESEDVYVFTAIWGVANICISLQRWR